MVSFLYNDGMRKSAGFHKMVLWHFKLLQKRERIDVFLFIHEDRFFFVLLIDLLSGLLAKFWERFLSRIVESQVQKKMKKKQSNCDRLLFWLENKVENAPERTKQLEDHSQLHYYIICENDTTDVFSIWGWGASIYVNLHST